jgi:hypothetical protein
LTLHDENASTAQIIAGGGKSYDGRQCGGSLICVVDAPIASTTFRCLRLEALRIV